MLVAFVIGNTKLKKRVRNQMTLIERRQYFKSEHIRKYDVVEC